MDSRLRETRRRRFVRVCYLSSGLVIPEGSGSIVISCFLTLIHFSTSASIEAAATRANALDWDGSSMLTESPTVSGAEMKVRPCSCVLICSRLVAVLRHSTRPAGFDLTAMVHTGSRYVLKP